MVSKITYSLSDFWILSSVPIKFGLQQYYLLLFCNQTLDETVKVLLKKCTSSVQEFITRSKDQLTSWPGLRPLLGLGTCIPTGSALSILISASCSLSSFRNSVRCVMSKVLSTTYDEPIDLITKLLDLYPKRLKFLFHRILCITFFRLLDLYFLASDMLD